MYICTNHQLGDAHEKSPLLDLVGLFNDDQIGMKWMFLDADVITDGSQGFVPVDSVRGKILSHSEAVSFCTSIQSMIDITLVGSRDSFRNFEIKNYKNRNDMIHFDVFVEFFDSTTWTFFCRDEDRMVKALKVLYQSEFR